jgi:hypothetical protein
VRRGSLENLSSTVTIAGLSRFERPALLWMRRAGYAMGEWDSMSARCVGFDGEQVAEDFALVVIVLFASVT